MKSFSCWLILSRHRRAICLQRYLLRQQSKVKEGKRSRLDHVLCEVVFFLLANGWVVVGAMSLQERIFRVNWTFFEEGKRLGPVPLRVVISLLDCGVVIIRLL